MSYMNNSFTTKSAGAQASQTQLRRLVALQAGLPAQGSAVSCHK